MSHSQKHLISSCIAVCCTPGFFILHCRLEEVNLKISGESQHFKDKIKETEELQVSMYSLCIVM